MGEIWASFKELIFFALSFIHDITGDWGVAIIALTVLMRLALMPVTIKQTKSMYELQRIQPKLKELQVKYADDKEKMQEETMKFYTENKVNPFGGCLPTLAQMPIFIALYGVLGTSKNGPGLLMSHLKDTGEVGRFLFMIPDIAKSPSAVFAESWVAAIPYVILVVLFGLSIWLPQALMPGEKQQKMIGLYMAVLMLFFGWKAPAGVLLYWDISSIWGVAQQQLLTSSLKHHTQDEVIEVPAKSSKSSKAKKPKGSK